MRTIAIASLAVLVLVVGCNSDEADPPADTGPEPSPAAAAPTSDGATLRECGNTAETGFEPLECTAVQIDDPKASEVAKPVHDLLAAVGFNHVLVADLTRVRSGVIQSLEVQNRGAAVGYIHQFDSAEEASRSHFVAAGADAAAVICDKYVFTTAAGPETNRGAVRAFAIAVRNLNCGP